MRQLFYGSVFCFAVAVSGAAQAGQLPGVGPNPSWTDNQQFEWYLGYMSDATALCGDYGLSSSLAKIATLSPYGRDGMSSISGDRFGGGVCGGIRKEAKELLEKKELYIRYMEATYDCSAGAKCEASAGSDPLTSKHRCTAQVRETLSALEIATTDVKSLRFQSKLSGPSNGAEPDHRARVQLKSCSGSVYVELNDRCSVSQSYTRGDCELAGVDAR